MHNDPNPSALELWCALQPNSEISRIHLENTLRNDDEEMQKRHEKGKKKAAGQTECM